MPSRLILSDRYYYTRQQLARGYSGGARVSGAWGIDHFGAPSFRLSSPSTSSPTLPLEVGPLEVGPLNPPRESGERCKHPNGVWGLAANDFGTYLRTQKRHWWHLKCALFYAHAHSCLNWAHIIFVYFVSQKNITPPFGAPSSCWRPGAYAFSAPTRRHYQVHWSHTTTSIIYWLDDHIHRRWRSNTCKSADSCLLRSPRDDIRE